MATIGAKDTPGTKSTGGLSELYNLESTGHGLGSTRLSLVIATALCYMYDELTQGVLRLLCCFSCMMEREEIECSSRSFPCKNAWLSQVTG